MSPLVLMRPVARSSPPLAGFGVAAGPLWRGLARAAAWPARAWRARRHLAELGAMSDLQLRDIGLTRADVISATAFPRDEDPTERLALVVQERRIARGRRAP